MKWMGNINTVKGIGRESFLLLFGAWVSYVCLRLALLGDPDVDIRYSSPGFWLFIVSPYLGLQLIRSIKWAHDNFTEIRE